LASVTQEARIFFGVLGGRLFENVAIRALAAGGTFKVRAQPSPAKKWVWEKSSTQVQIAATLQVNQLAIVDEELDMARALFGAGVMPTGPAHAKLTAHLGGAALALPAAVADHFGIPASPNFPAIDAFRVQTAVAGGSAILQLFQMKNVQEDNKREIKVAHLNRFLTYVPAPVRIELYQVVPLPHWPSAKVLPFIFRDGGGCGRRSTATHSRVRHGHSG
jgi:hypothetical protein